MSNEIPFPDFEPCQPSPSVADRLTLLTKLNEIKSQMQEVSPKPDKTPEITMAQLNYFRNPNNQEGRFRTFTIPKKTGGVRIITAPLSPEYRWLLRALNVWLQSMYTPSDYAMGFVKQRSVCSNAQAHAGKNYIFNLDLKDFFPSIRQARVCARLQCPPFSFTQEVASTVAGLVAMRLEEPLSLTETHVSYVLPQGSPVSPLLTNAICDALDRQLAGLAKRFGLTYTRYADDLTFSSMHNVYHEDGEFLAELRRIIAKEGFQINEKKTRLQKRGMRQEVTGVVVNEKTNVTRQYMREIRNLLYIWERYGYMAALYRWNEHYRKYGAAYKTKHVTMIRVIRGKLMYMRMVKGKTDTTYRTLYARFKTLLSTWYRNATYIHNVRRMAAHRLLDFEKYIEREIIQPNVPKKLPAISEIIGNFALQGINGVKVTVNLCSLLSSTALAAIIPGTLQPAPTINGTSDLPDIPIFLKNLSNKNVILDIYPTVSSKDKHVNKIIN